VRVHQCVYLPLCPHPPVLGTALACLPCAVIDAIRLEADDKGYLLFRAVALDGNVVSSPTYPTSAWKHSRFGGSQNPQRVRCESTLIFAQ